MFDIIEFSNQLQDLIIENRELRIENARLRKVEEDYYEFVNHSIQSHNDFVGNIFSTLFEEGIKSMKKPDK